VNRRRFLSATGGALLVMGSQGRLSANEQTIVAALGREFVLIDGATFSVVGTFSIPPDPLHHSPALVGRFNDMLLVAQTRYDARTTWRTDVYAYRPEAVSNVLFSLPGDGTFSALNGEQVAFIQFTADRVVVRGIAPGAKEGVITVPTPSAAVLFGSAIAIAGQAGITLHDKASFRPLRDATFSNVTYLAASGERLVVVHDDGTTVSELDPHLKLRRSMTSALRVGAISVIGENLLAIGSYECDRDRGETALIDVRTGHALWRSNAAVAPIAISARSKSLIVGDAKCGAPLHGILYKLSIVSGEVLSQTELPGTGLHQVLA
jgi:hypothetical protein